MASRKIKIAAAQVGSIHRDANRKETLNRLISLLEKAASEGVKLVLFPEIALTTFFPRYLFHSQEDLEAYFEHSNEIAESPNLKPLFDKAHTLSIDICVGFAERPPEGKGYNTCVYYSSALNQVISKYRKVHLPGTKEPLENPNAVNQLEKRYFEPGDLGFQAFRAPGLLHNALKADTANPEADTSGEGDAILGMMICNDRRWPEAWRCYGLQGVELVLCGYNTNGWAPDLRGIRKDMTREEAERDSLFHHQLVMQANSYMNSCFSVCAARCGMDDGKYSLIAGSCVVDPEGYIVAEAKTKGDELIVKEVDLEECRAGKTKVCLCSSYVVGLVLIERFETFDFERHRRVETYGLITERTGVVEPDLL